jgi:hypothetical protein
VPTNGGRSVGIVPSWTQDTGVFFSRRLLKSKRAKAGIRCHSGTNIVRFFSMIIETMSK